MPRLHRRNQNAPQWMIVYTTHIFEEAHIIVGRLVSEGIAAIVQREAVAGAIGLSVGRLGQVNVLVKPDDYELAHRILNTPPNEPQLRDTNQKITYHWDDKGDDENDDDDDLD